MVSVLCAVYDHEKTLRRCFEGFLAQRTEFPFEVLVHDDASTDGSAALIREYAGRYPAVFRPVFQRENQYSQGVKVVREVLAPLIRGEYVALCEGDDFWTDPEKLSRQRAALERAPDRAMCVHRVRVLDGAGNSAGTLPAAALPEGPLPPETVIAASAPPLFQTSSFFFRAAAFREYMERFPAFARISDVGDLCYLLYFAQAGGVLYLDREMSCYRRDLPGSWTGRVLPDPEKLAAHYDRLAQVFEAYDAYTGGRFHSLCLEKQREARLRRAFAGDDFQTLLKKEDRALAKRLYPRPLSWLLFRLGARSPRALAAYRRLKARIIKN